MSQQKLKTLKDFDFKNKQVFMRVDFNVPIHNQVIQDSSRIEKTFPSIEFIMEQGGKIVLASHLGRPEGKRNLECSLNSVAEYLSEKKNLEVFFIENYDSPLIQKLLKGLNKGQVILLENLRFHPGEESLDLNLAKELSRWTDIYINEAFGISHRDHTSISLLPELVDEKGIGLQFEKEIQMLSPILTHELKKPFCVVLGGSKLKDKIPLIDSLIDQADEFLIGGLMAYTFLKAKGFKLGQNFIEKKCLNLAHDLIERLEIRNKKLFLPYDFKGEINASLSSQGKSASPHPAIKSQDKSASPHPATKSQGLSQSSLSQSEKFVSSWNLETFPSSAVAYDIGEKSLNQFQERVKKAGSVFWNGPMGYFEKKEYMGGTLGLAQALAQNKTAYRVVGGGHSALAVRDFENEIDHISTGGGASLAYLKGKTLIGIKKLYS